MIKVKPSVSIDSEVYNKALEKSKSIDSTFSAETEKLWRKYLKMLKDEDKTYSTWPEAKTGKALDLAINLRSEGYRGAAGLCLFLLFATDKEREIIKTYLPDLYKHYAQYHATNLLEKQLPLKKQIYDRPLKEGDPDTPEKAYSLLGEKGERLKGKWSTLLWSYENLWCQVWFEEPIQSYEMENWLRNAGFETEYGSNKNKVIEGFDYWVKYRVKPNAKNTRVSS